MPSKSLAKKAWNWLTPKAGGAKPAPEDLEIQQKLLGGTSRRKSTAPVATRKKLRAAARQATRRTARL